MTTSTRESATPREVHRDKMSWKGQRRNTAHKKGDPTAVPTLHSFTSHVLVGRRRWPKCAYQEAEEEHENKPRNLAFEKQDQQCSMDSGANGRAPELLTKA